MHLFLTSVLPLLAHDHASAVAFLTCRHHNFHSSIIPEFLSDEERVKTFCELKLDKERQYMNLYNLFVQTPLMQFSPSLVLRGYSAKSILNSLLEMKYFTRTLQRCVVRSALSLALFQALSKIRSLTELDLVWLENQHLEIIVNSFPSLETLTICNASLETKIKVNSLPSSVTKTLRSLTLAYVDALPATSFIPHFLNLRKLVVRGCRGTRPPYSLDLLPLSASLLLLTLLMLDRFSLENTESLQNLVHLSSLQFRECRVPNIDFLTQDNILPHLTTLRINRCKGLSPSSFAPLSHAQNLHVLEVDNSEDFNNDCLQYLNNMVHLRSLDLSGTDVVGDSRLLKTLTQNLLELEELNLRFCRIGNQGAISGALYSTHSRLRVLILRHCGLVDSDVNGIGALKNTLAELDLGGNYELTQQALVHCKDLVKLKILKLVSARINDLSPLKHCVKLESLDFEDCSRLNDVSFKVFTVDPNSFPKLRFLDVSYCDEVTYDVIRKLSKRNVVCCSKIRDWMDGY